ncbi:hypothetical protein [Bacillus smithii]|uniref:hypothetical protein n=1 Tax=Bacillus smithii TaxID=1479 RepID=UPI002E20F961|nr:hypothetical protein [Bacillus smithii]MED4928984.1 hypothetical protein [Bacillus smithii]
MELKNTYLGFAENIKPLQRARKYKSLDKLIRFNGTVMTEKEFIYTLLKEGYMPHIEANYSYYSKRLDAMTKPKTDYQMLNEQTSSFYSVTKTDYEFASYIIKNGFLDEQKAKEFIINEQLQKEEQQRKEAEQRQKEEEEHQERMRKQREKEEAERLEKIKKWTEIGKQLMNEQVKNAITATVENRWDQIKSQFPATDKDELINNIINAMPQYLGNYEYIKNHVQYLIHDDINKNNLTNMIYKDIYMTIFNVSETDSKRTITAKIKSFYTGKEYKGNSKPTIKETFYFYDLKNSCFVEAEGEKIDIEGHTCFVRQLENGKYVITEAKTGVSLAGSHDTKKEAIETAKEKVKQNKEKMDDIIRKTIERYGISPLYEDTESA